MLQSPGGSPMRQAGLPKTSRPQLVVEDAGESQAMEHRGGGEDEVTQLNNMQSLSHGDAEDHQNTLNYDSRKTAGAQAPSLNPNIRNTVLNTNSQQLRRVNPSTTPATPMNDLPQQPSRQFQALSEVQDATVAARQSTDECEEYDFQGKLSDASPR